MSRPLISRSPDLQRLRDDGYEIEISGSCLLIHSVPYVAADKTVKVGTLVSELTLAGDVTAAPSTHVAMFVGEHPCNRDGTEIVQIKHSSVNQTVRDGMTATHQFSNLSASLKLPAPDGWTVTFVRGGSLSAMNVVRIRTDRVLRQARVDASHS